MKVCYVDKDCKSIPEAVDVIEQYEGLIGEPCDKRRSQVRMVKPDQGSNPKSGNYNRPYQQHKSRPYNNTFNETMKELVVRLERLEESMKTPDANKPRYPEQTQLKRTCYICRSPDHFFRECPTYLKCQNEKDDSPANNTRS